MKVTKEEILTFAKEAAKKRGVSLGEEVEGYETPDLTKYCWTIGSEYRITVIAPKDDDSKPDAFLETGKMDGVVWKFNGVTKIEVDFKDPT